MKRYMLVFCVMLLSSTSTKSSCPQPITGETGDIDAEIKAHAIGYLNAGFLEAMLCEIHYYVKKGAMATGKFIYQETKAGWRAASFEIQKLGKKQTVKIEDPVFTAIEGLKTIQKSAKSAGGTKDLLKSTTAEAYGINLAFTGTIKRDLKAATDHIAQTIEEAQAWAEKGKVLVTVLGKKTTASLSSANKKLFKTNLPQLANDLMTLLTTLFDLYEKAATPKMRSISDQKTLEPLEKRFTMLADKTFKPWNSDYQQTKDFKIRLSRLAKLAQQTTTTLRVIIKEWKA